MSYLLFIVSAACSALDYHGTSRRLFVGLASGTISVSAEFMEILMQSSHFFYICHLHISHNIPYCSLKILQKNCHQFHLERLYYPEEMKNKGYAKYGGKCCVLLEMGKW